MIRVLAVDDHPTLLRGIVGVMEEADDIDIVAVARSVERAEELIRRHRVDVVVTDSKVGEGEGIVLAPVVEECGAKMVVFSQYTAERLVLGVFRAGAHGYVLKESDSAVLRDAVRVVASGGTFIDPSVAAKVVAAATRRATAKGPFGLTPQELRVVELLPRRMSNHDIARALGISVDTVKTHMRHALRKLQVKDRTAAARVAVESGIA